MLLLWSQSECSAFQHLALGTLVWSWIIKLVTNYINHFFYSVWFYPACPTSYKFTWHQIMLWCYFPCCLLCRHSESEFVYFFFLFLVLFLVCSLFTFALGFNCLVICVLLLLFWDYLRYVIKAHFLPHATWLRTQLYTSLSFKDWLFYVLLLFIISELCTFYFISIIYCTHHVHTYCI